MARIARVVVPNYPHHITQRGNRKQQTFFNDRDYRAYIYYLKSFADKYSVHIWAYCLMPNHVHLVMVPEDERGLSLCLARTHRKYALRINHKNDWQGHLWQQRFHSFVMDEQHLRAAVRYVEMNPVRAGLCEFPEDWKWSSAKAHISGIDDGLVKTKPMLDRVSCWHSYLADSDPCSHLEVLRKHSKTGRPAGDDDFISVLESLTGRELKLKKGGRKRSN